MLHRMFKLESWNWSHVIALWLKTGEKYLEFWRDRTWGRGLTPMWRQYGRGEMSATGLLEQLSTKYKPAV